MKWRTAHNRRRRKLIAARRPRLYAWQLEIEQALDRVTLACAAATVHFHQLGRSLGKVRRISDA